MAVNLTPSDAMAAAAKRGLELAGTRGGGGLEPATKARARKIADKSPLTPAHVKRMHSFFSRHAVDRKPDWGKAGKETPGYVAWQLWGGDAGKAWAAAKTKALSGAGVNMDEDQEKHEFAELFFADAKPSTIEADDEGLIWKPMLPVGIWKIGPNGRPLKVVAGKSPDQRQAIGMQDVIEAFNASAVPHVTVPLSHEDKVDENTGYLRKLKVATHNGIKTLFGGHEFTDKKVKQKVMEGSIANTSVGLEFDYVRKDDGKKFPVVLRHNALTNRPWLGRKLAPFGLDESEADNYVVMCGEFSEAFDDDNIEDQEHVDLWDNALTYAEVRDAIVVLSEGEVIDIATDRVLLKKDDKNFVAKFSIEDGDVVLDESDNWIEREVKLDEENVEDDHTEDVESKSTSGEPDTITEMSDKDTTTERKGTVPEDEKKDEGTPQGTAQVVDLSEHPEFKAQQEENARLKARLDQLAAKDRKNEADSFVRELKDMGLDEEHGFTDLLKYTRNILLSDEGETALLLSEDGDAAPRSVTAATIVKELLSKFPTKDGKVAMQLSEQQTDPLDSSKNEKPPVEPEGEQLSEDERIAAADAWYDEAFGVKKTTTQTKES